jgi:hypothetical protein
MFKSLDMITSIKPKKLFHDKHTLGYGNLNEKQLVQNVKAHKLNVFIKDGMVELLAVK